MNVSVIIPTYNEEKDIKDCLESLKKQSLKNFQIIVVDDGSTDNTLEIAKRYDIEIIKSEHKGPGFSRNLGAKKARGEILIFIDSDMTFDKNYLKNLTLPFKNKKIIGTTHDYELAVNLNNRYAGLWGKVRVDHRSKKQGDEIKNSAFRAIRKNKFLEFGGFDPKFGYADDKTLWFKYKLAPSLAKHTICYHKNPETLKAVYRQSRWIGASIDCWIFNIPVINYLSILLLILASPLLILVLSVLRAGKNKEVSTFGWMLSFMFFRYFGTIAGVSRRIFFKVNFR